MEHGNITVLNENSWGIRLVKTDLKKRSRVDVVNKYGEKLKVLFSGDYKAFDYGDPQSATELIVCGLGLGYPLESTAYILSR